MASLSFGIYPAMSNSWQREDKKKTKPFNET